MQPVKVLSRDAELLSILLETATNPRSEIGASVAILAISISSFKPAARRYFTALLGSEDRSLPRTLHRSDSRSGRGGPKLMQPRHKGGSVQARCRLMDDQSKALSSMGASRGS